LVGTDDRPATWGLDGRGELDSVRGRRAELLGEVRRTLRGKGGGWRLNFATSAGRALDMSETEAFDAIVTDVNMPWRDGLELLADLPGRGRTADIPVIILTGNSDDSLKRRALDLGTTDPLNKPVNREDLTRIIHG
jgi:CheY-like chemotaxis protein